MIGWHGNDAPEYFPVAGLSDSLFETGVTFSVVCFREG
jgi:hypothetical protein